MNVIDTNSDRQLEQVTCCQEVPEHRDRVDAAGAPFQPGDVLDSRFLIAEVLSRSGMGTEPLPASLGRGRGYACPLLVAILVLLVLLLRQRAGSP